MKNKLILLLALIIGLGIIAFVILQVTNGTKTNNQIQEKNKSSVSYQTQVDEKGSVVVEVTPILLASENNTSFTVSFTTHSGDLNYNILAIAKLIDNKGNVYEPISWSGGKGGHHLEGNLTFPKISAEADSVTLTIPGIDKIDRVFTWDLK